MGDKYDVQVKYLTENPSEIQDAWPHGEHAAHILFASVDYMFCCQTWDTESSYGCLTQIRGESYEAPTEELTEAILADVRIPEDFRHIKASDLPIFAEWQRRLDKELGRD